MAQKVVRNPDGSVTYIDTTTGAQRTFADGGRGPLISQNFERGAGVSGNVQVNVDREVQRRINQQAQQASQPYRDRSTGGVPSSLVPAQQAAERARSAGLGVLDAPRTFTLDDLRRAAQQVAGAGHMITVPEARFQTTEGIGELIQQMYSQLQPLTDARLAANLAEANRRAMQLQNQLAATGSLRGGGAVSQMLDAERAFQRAQDVIRAEQLAQAIPLAFDAANLGLSEAQMLFAMEEANRQFALNRAQQFFNNLAQGMSLEEAQRQFRAGLEADLAQNAVQNLLAIQRQQEAMRQFDTAQDLAERQFAEGIRQFDTTFREGQRQFNIGTALEMSQIFGMPVAPAMSGQVLFDRVAGQMPIAARQIIAQITGVDPVTGQATFSARQAAAQAAARSAGGGTGAGAVSDVYSRALQMGSPQAAYAFLVQQGVPSIDAQRFIENAFAQPADIQAQIQAAINAVDTHLAMTNWERANPDAVRGFLIEQAREALKSGDISGPVHDAVVQAIWQRLPRGITAEDMRQLQIDRVIR